MRQTNSSSPGSPSSGCCYRPKALAWLETAMRLRDAGLVYLKTDPLLDPLGKEARFQAIAQALKFPDKSCHLAGAIARGRVDKARRAPYPPRDIMKFCNQCGAPVRLLIPAGDNLPRHVCDACGAIHYENPRLVVGCVAEHEGRILLCRRAIEPRRGYWTVPAGFMENGETLQQAAAREAREEALAEVAIGSLLSVVHVLHADQVHVFFRAGLPTARYAAGSESLEVALVDPADIPWGDIAFPSTDFTLRRYLEDRAAGREPYHFTSIDRRLQLGSPRNQASGSATEAQRSR